MFLFGLRADEAEALRAAGYDPQAYVRRSPWLGRVLEHMSRGYADGESYADLVGGLLDGLDGGDVLTFELRANPTVRHGHGGKSRRHDVVMNAKRMLLDSRGLAR